MVVVLLLLLNSTVDIIDEGAGDSSPSDGLRGVEDGSFEDGEERKIINSQRLLAEVLVCRVVHLAEGNII